MNPDIPDWLNQVVMKCLERDPARRYQNAREILNDLDLRQPPSGFAPSMSIRLPQMAVNVPMNKRMLVGIVAGALVITSGVGVVGYRYMHRSSADQVAAVPEHRVAVLPVKVLGDEAQFGYIGTGITEALIAKLSQSKELNVTSASAVQKINPADPIPEIAKSLGVKYVVQGSVQGSGDKILVILNVLDDQGKTVGENLQPFSGQRQDLLTLEDNMYKSLIPALSLNSGTALANTLHPTEDTAAYELYLKGRNTFTRGELDPKNVQTAIDLYSQAIKDDPNFALAWAGLADAYLRVYKSSKDPNAASKPWQPLKTPIAFPERTVFLKFNTPSEAF